MLGFNLILGVVMYMEGERKNTIDAKIEEPYLHFSQHNYL